MPVVQDSELEDGEDTPPRRRRRRTSNRHDDDRPFDERSNDLAEESPETRTDTWRNRRRMAWIALISMIVFTVYLFQFAPVEKLKPLGDVITWYYMTMSTIVCAYMGLATYAYISRKK